MERQTDIQMPYSCSDQLNSGLNRRQIPCSAASQRPTGLLLVVLSSPNCLCRLTPDGKGIVLPMVTSWRQWQQLQQRNCGYAQQNANFLWHYLLCDSQVKLILEIMSFSNFQGKNQHINIQQDITMVIFICFEIQILTLDTALIWMLKSHSRAGWEILMCESKWCTQLSVLLGRSARYSSTRAKRCLHILSIHKLWNCIREDTTLLLKWVHDPLWASIQWSLSVIRPSGMGDTGPLERTASITLRVQEITTDTLKQENAEDEKQSPRLQK